MLLDQPAEKPITKISGNNQLLKGTIYALITLIGFCFLFVFVDMDWQHFSPLAPFIGLKDKNQYMFYFISFCYFICSLSFSSIFYRNNLQPTDLLLRFAIVLVTFLLVYMLYQLCCFALEQPKNIIFSCFRFFPYNNGLTQLLNGALTFLCFYLLFYALILVFSKLFYHGHFGTAGFIFCFFITAIFYTAIFYLAPMELQLNKTSFPFQDFTVILFFSLVSFGAGVLSGTEQVKSKSKYSRNHLRSL